MPIKTVSATTPVSILMLKDLQLSVGMILDNTAKNADGVCKAGTPIYGDLTKRDNGGNDAYVKATSVVGVKGVYKAQLTAFANDEVFIINGVTYTCAAAEDVATKKFAGANAAAQVTSLVKMIALAGWAVTAGAAAETDRLVFTQLAPMYTMPEIVEAAEVGAIGNLVQVTAPVVGSSNAVGVLLHDVTFEGNDDANATLLLFGFVDTNKLDEVTAALITAEVKAALKGSVTFLKS